MLRETPKIRVIARMAQGLTTIRQPLTEIGEMGSRTLVALIEAGHVA